jgi:hypothetical protein
MSQSCRDEHESRISVREVISCRYGLIDPCDFPIRDGNLHIEPEPSCDGTFKIPNFDYVHAELAKPHVTLKLLWEAGRLTMPPKLFNF